MIPFFSPRCSCGSRPAIRHDDRNGFAVGVPRMWVFGGIITWSKSWVNIAAAKKATARSVSLPVFSNRVQSWHSARR